MCIRDSLSGVSSANTALRLLDIHPVCRLSLIHILPNGKPLCDRCPAAGFCAAKRDGKQALLPVREKKKEKREVRLTLFIMKKEDGTARCV